MILEILLPFLVEGLDAAHTATTPIAFATISLRMGMFPAHVVRTEML